jgi:NAD-dependent SIR2 family protein deacetylase
MLKKKECSRCGKSMDGSYEAYSIRFIRDKEVVTCAECDVDSYVRQKNMEE